MQVIEAIIPSTGEARLLVPLTISGIRPNSKVTIELRVTAAPLRKRGRPLGTVKNQEIAAPLTN